MKITDLKATAVGSDWGNLAFVKLYTDEGITGLGDASLCFSVPAVVATLEDTMKPLLLGKDPFQIEKLWATMYSMGAWSTRAAFAAMSGVDQALWDIVGKALNVPVYNLLGGRCHDRLRAYTHLSSRENRPEEYAEQAVTFVEGGWTALKFDPFDGAWGEIDSETLRNAVSCFRAVRKAVGDDIDLALEAHSRFNAHSAIRIAQELEEYHPYWFEEPVPPDDLEGYDKVAAATTIPIATGESRDTKYQFQELLDRQVADIIQPDICYAGGITELKKIAAMAEARRLLFAPHNGPTGPVGSAASMQLCATLPNFLILEMAQLNLTTWQSQLITEPFQVIGGYLELPTGPGLGVELNEAVAAAHPYRPFNVPMAYFGRAFFAR